MTAIQVNADFPPGLQVLFQPKRYKVLYGGRGGAKSWGIARALLLLGTQRPLRVLCAREFQNSIRDSVHKLLSDQVQLLGLGSFYDVQQTSIRGTNGTEFSFEGIRHNIGKIRSYEGIDICWVEEAMLVSASSWEVLIPTIRKNDSEIWISFNPELETDETYQRFVIHAPDNASVVKLSYRDNPWFPATLRKEMEDLKLRDYDAYLHVWEGNCRVVLDGAVYAEEIRTATYEGRFTTVEYDKLVPVQTFWDIGRSAGNATAIWFAQPVAMEYRILEYYEDSLRGLDHYIDVLQDRALNKKGPQYTYDMHWLPHDAKALSLGTKVSVEEQLRDKMKNVRIVPKLSVSDGIEAARSIFPHCWFDAKGCAEGIKALRNYHYDLIEGTQTFSRAPVHDWSSNGADGWRYLAVALRVPRQRNTDGVISRMKAAIARSAFPQEHGWMG